MGESSGGAPHTIQLAGRRELLERTVHDLKNPLAVVRATLEWLEVELTDRPDALDAVLDASTSAARMMAIVDDLDTIARLETGLTVTRARVQVDEIIGTVVASAGSRLAPRRITVAATAPIATEANVDQGLLTRATDALVDVCARGTPAGACIELVPRMLRDESADEGGGGMLEIEVGIRGVVSDGSPAASIDTLASGGLGVYLALRVLEAHGGTLHVIPTATVPRVVARFPSALAG